MQRTRKRHLYRQSRRKKRKKKGGSWLWDTLTGRNSSWSSMLTRKSNTKNTNASDTDKKTGLFSSWPFMFTRKSNTKASDTDNKTGQRSWLSIFGRSNTKKKNSNTHDSNTGDNTGLPNTPEDIPIKVLNSTNQIDDGTFEFKFDKHKKVSELKKEIFDQTGIPCGEDCKLYQILEKKKFLLDDKKTITSQDKLDTNTSTFVVAINEEFDYVSQLDESMKRIRAESAEKRSLAAEKRSLAAEKRSLAAKHKLDKEHDVETYVDAQAKLYKKLAQLYILKEKQPDNEELNNEINILENLKKFLYESMKSISDAENDAARDNAAQAKLQENAAQAKLGTALARLHIMKTKETGNQKDEINEKIKDLEFAKKFLSDSI